MMTAKIERKKISRRKFLNRTGWVAAGLTVTAAAAFPFVRAAVPVLPLSDDPTMEDGLAWVQALPDGRIRFFGPRMEMGQGATLGLSQVVAEELNVGQSDIECVTPATNQTPVFRMTVGSESIRNFFDPVSLAAAQLREALRERASVKVGISVSEIKDGNGGFVLPDETQIKYGELVGAKAVILSVQDLPSQANAVSRYSLQRKGKFKSLGKAWKHHELEAIVTGQIKYSRDVVLDGMVYAQIIHPPVFGARIKNLDTSSTDNMPDITVISFDQGNDFAGRISFVGVVSSDLFALPAAVDAIKVEWEIANVTSQSELDALLDVARVRDADDFEHILSENGDVDGATGDAKYKALARYDTPIAAHSAMEPRAALAWVQSDKVEIWCGSQDSFFARDRVADAIGRKADVVVVYPLRMGGGFGGRVLCQPSIEAALLSAAVGKPVRVQWSREAEFQNNYFQPAYSHMIDAGVTDQGKISHWQHDFVSSPIITGFMPKNIGWIADRVMSDFGTSRGALPPYQMLNSRIRFSDIRTDVPIGPWRSLGAAPNAFAIESMVDELAVLAGIDPLEFRLKNLPPQSQRLAAVLRKVAEISDWSSPKEMVSVNFGRGIACSVYKQETPVAVVVDVLVDETAKEIRVKKIWCVQDCGLVINPNQVENMVMGNIIWGCSMALKEQITIDGSSVEQDNFHTYEILRHHEAPEIEISLIDSNEAPVGVGESALPPVAPAIANALFAATGKRIRKLPINYDIAFANNNA